MILPLIDQRIRRAFSNSAVHYEVLSSLQREIGRELVQRIIDQEPAGAVLDIGMGTGYLTNKLQQTFAENLVVGLDFAPGMIEQARKKYEEICIVQAHAEAIPFRPQSFDIAVSNLAYQWVNNLPRSFQSVRRVLKKDGQLVFTMFGYDTLKELFEVLQSPAVNSRVNIRRLPKYDDVQVWLQTAGFSSVVLTREFITTHFEDMLSLVRWLKQIGANTLPRDAFIGRDFLFKASEIYNEKFKERLGIKATFEVVWVTAKNS